MSKQNQPTVPDGYSYLVTAILFLLGGFVTAVFSGSLVRLTSKAGLFEVLAIGMIVPSFTWLVHLSASGICMNSIERRLYWGDLGRICLWGSLALLPAAAVNLAIARPPIWASAVNVVCSVAIMAIQLFRLSRKHSRSIGWPISWTLTITLNMTLFVMSSWSWW
jgi:hypothetical protein